MILNNEFKKEREEKKSPKRTVEAGKEGGHSRKRQWHKWSRHSPTQHSQFKEMYEHHQTH